MKRSAFFVHVVQLMFAAFVLSCASSLALAQGHEGHDHSEKAKNQKEFLGKGDGIETCPVTAEPISKEESAELFGRTVYFCCTNCVAKAKANPELYVKPTAEEQKKAIKGKEDKPKKSEAPQTEFLGKGDGVDTCPVTGTAVNKELKSEVNGRVFYVCCSGCIDAIKANPDAYLKKK